MEDNTILEELEIEIPKEKEIYLRIDGDNFGFVHSDINDITSTDIKITKEEYDNFFELQSKGKCYRLKKNPTGNMLFDYIEEYEAEKIVSNTPRMFERIEALESVLLEMLGDE